MNRSLTSSASIKEGESDERDKKRKENLEEARRLKYLGRRNEAWAKYNAKDICFCTCAITMKEINISMSLTGSMVKDLMDKWLIPKKSRFVFQNAATSMIFSVGQKDIQQHGIEK